MLLEKLHKNDISFKLNPRKTLTQQNESLWLALLANNLCLKKEYENRVTKILYGDKPGSNPFEDDLSNSQHAY